MSSLTPPGACLAVLLFLALCSAPVDSSSSAFFPEDVTLPTVPKTPIRRCESLARNNFALDGQDGHPSRFLPVNHTRARWFCCPWAFAAPLSLRVGSLRAATCKGRAAPTMAAEGEHRECGDVQGEHRTDDGGRRGAPRVVFFFFLFFFAHGEEKISEAQPATCKGRTAPTMAAAPMGRRAVLGAGLSLLAGLAQGKPAAAGKFFGGGGVPWLSLLAGLAQGKPAAAGKFLPVVES
ncbi:hypothetical protein T484DRAFT_1795299 [Baffinella frigidus]|nr:hypothetical protein T484DRAFT_1795299 [Cryptophyta sp. CCMP2293]